MNLGQRQIFGKQIPKFGSKWIKWIKVENLTDKREKSEREIWTNKLFFGGTLTKDERTKV